MPEFPVMGTSDNGDIHRIGKDAEGQWWTACGMRAETMPCILAYNPTCPNCLQHIDGSPS